MIDFDTLLNVPCSIVPDSGEVSELCSRRRVFIPVYSSTMSPSIANGSEFIHFIAPSSKLFLQLQCVKSRRSTKLRILQQIPLSLHALLHLETVRYFLCRVDLSDPISVSTGRLNKTANAASTAVTTTPPIVEKGTFPSCLKWFAHTDCIIGTTCSSSQMGKRTRVRQTFLSSSSLY